MKILVFSDSHGKYKRMAEVFSRDRYDVVLFLGDGMSDFERLQKENMTSTRMIAVKGNCDFFDGTPEERILDLDGFRILMLHGHTKNVKHGTTVLEYYAREKGVDLVLYGHTHSRDIRRIEGENSFYIFNPGSIGASGYLNPSFGYIETVGGQIVLNVAEYR
jgi:putative phosphoesterase